MPTEPSHPAAARSLPAGAAGCEALWVSVSFAGTPIVERCLRPTEDTFVVGDTRRSDAPFPGIHAFDIALVSRRNGRFLLRFDPRWRGWVTTERSQWSLAELAHHPESSRSDDDAFCEYPLPAHCTVQLDRGHTRFCIRPGLGPRPVERLPFRLCSRRLRTTLGVCSILVLAFLVGISQIPTADAYLEDAPFAEIDRLVALRSEALELASTQRTLDPPAPPKPTAIDTTKERALMDTALAEPLVLPDDIAPGSREAAIYIGSRTGVVGLLGALQTMELAKTIRNFQIGENEDPRETYGDLAPGDVDAATGAWGHGIRKMGPGSGDGKDWGTIKSKGYRLASAAGRGDDYVAQALSRPHESSAPAVSKAAASILGSGIPYDVIRGQLGMRKRKLRSCFELDPSDDAVFPSELTMSFAISPSGAVGEAATSDIENLTVRSCLEDTLLSIRFPVPTDGQEVRIERFALRI